MRGISMMVFLLLNLFCLHETTIARPESISLLKPLFCNDYIASKVDQFQTTLCPPPDNSNFVTIKSLKEYNTALENLEDKRLPGILYFTSEWCLSCKSLLSPFLKEESNKYSDVTTYKIDVDEEDLESVLSQLRISSVPILHFFKNGKKASEVVNADFAKIKSTMKELYGKH
ncbi:thioredoxin O2, mitochondrial-like isoform X3 [Mercurialis annua]|uniref:thioredoxin O2, mitochondrial-like isoform X3 n=1 Tax=Mercurialis annua TaxID=3986 RepID=UPI00215F8285|nr:thioredoxin O2, mitochondrial-like isoform X3 [Mercurialis annua]